jgi:pyruvate-formate lyase-activating enzyme
LKQLLWQKKPASKNIFKSNGYIYGEPLKKLCGVIDAANIDLKAITESTYLKLTGGKLQPVLDTLKVYKDMGVWLEITNLVVPTWTDKSEEIRQMCLNAPKYGNDDDYADNIAAEIYSWWALSIYK